VVGDDEWNVDKAAGKCREVNGHGGIDVGVKEITAISGEGRYETGDERVTEGSGDGMESVDVNAFPVLIGWETGYVCCVDFHFVSGID
jgi:hypothetical protein